MGKARPVRMCIVCRTRRGQTELLRLVRSEDGRIHLDTGSHRAPGRGAYVCPARICVETLERRSLLQRAFKGEPAESLSDELHASLATTTDVQRPT